VRFAEIAVPAFDQFTVSAADTMTRYRWSAPNSNQLQLVALTVEKLKAAADPVLIPYARSRLHRRWGVRSRNSTPTDLSWKQVPGKTTAHAAQPGIDQASGKILWIPETQHGHFDRRRQFVARMSSA